MNLPYNTRRQLTPCSSYPPAQLCAYTAVEVDLRLTRQRTQIHPPNPLHHTRRTHSNPGNAIPEHNLSSSLLRAPLLRPPNRKIYTPSHLPRNTSDTLPTLFHAPQCCANKRHYYTYRSHSYHWLDAGDHYRCNDERHHLVRRTHTGEDGLAAAFGGVVEPSRSARRVSALAE